MIKKDNFGTRSNSKLAASGPIKAGTTNANLGGKSVVARANTPAQDPNLGRLVLTTIIQDIPKYSINGEGAQVAINYTSLQIPKEKELRHPLIAGIQVSLVSGNFSQLITITSTLALNDTTISVASFNPNVDIGKGALICIDEEDLFNQYQNKTKGTIAGFTVDSDGIAKSGIEITDWLNSDTMTGASVNNVPTALSVKNYVDNSHPAEDQTLQEVTDNGNTTTNDIILSSTNFLRASHSDRYVQIQNANSQMTFSSYGAHIHKTYDNVSYAERMRLSRFGDLSIGTTTGGYKLLVSGTGWGGEGIAINSTTTAGAVLTLKTTQREYQIASRGDSFEIRDITAGDIARIDINSTGRTTFGNSTNAGPLRVYYSDGSFVDYTGYGIELNRDYSYIRPTLTNNKRLFIGNQTLSWFELELNSTTTLFKNGTAEFMRITSTGNVGVGTTSPQELLHLFQQNHSNPLLIEVENDGYLAGTSAGIKLTSKSSDGVSGSWTIDNLNRDTLRFLDDGAEKMRITSAGNVGIGTSSPVYKLDVRNTGNLFYGQTDLTNTTSIFRIRANGGANEVLEIQATGNVGIGTSSPYQKLGVNGNIQIGNQGASAGFVIFNGTNVGLWNYENGYIRLGTNGAERLRITDAGNVGIGTSSPNAKVEILGSSNTTDMNVLHISNSNDIAKVKLGYASNSHGRIDILDGNDNVDIRLSTNTNSYFNGGNLGIGSTSPNRLLTLSASGGTYQAFNSTSNNNTTIGSDGVGAFVVYDDTASSYRMVVKASTGNVGIGTTNPAQGLHVLDSGILVSQFESSNNTTSQIQVTNSSGNDAYLGISGSRLVLNNNDYNANHLSITSGGNVLIGTTTDSGAKLNVVGGNLRVDNTGSTADYSEITERQFQVTRSGSSSGMELQTLGTYSGSGGFIDLKPKNTTAMRIAGDGNVLIGTTTDTGEKLKIVGENVLIDSTSNVYFTLDRADVNNRNALIQFKSGGTRDWMAGLFYGSSDFVITPTYADASDGITIKKTTGNLLIGTTTDSGNKLEVNGVASATTFAGDLRGTINTLTTGVTQTANDNSTKIATTAYVDNAEAGTSSFGSFTPTSTQSIASGGNVGVKSTLLLATSQVTASNITTSSAGLTFANAGLYQISFNFASKVSETANRTLAAANLEYSTDGETWTEIVGSLVYNYDRGTATSGGASSWGFVYDGSASCSFIHNLATSSIIRARFWIEGRASSASGITTIINGCRLSAHKIG